MSIILAFLIGLLCCIAPTVPAVDCRPTDYQQEIGIEPTFWHPFDVNDRTTPSRP